MSDALSSNFFSRDYFEARTRFRRRVEQCRGRLESIAIDARGPQGEPLTIDIASFGSEEPRRVLFHSSGLHGVEGFAGSAIQLQLLAELPTLPDGVSLTLVHILNPFGMTWLRRVNAANVDLNRNFLDGKPYSGAPRTYGQIDSLLNPPSPPARDLFMLKAPLLILRHGMSALKQAVAGGQYEYPKGLFFGGKELQPELAQLRAFLLSRFQTVESITAIDVHTGLGKRGEDLLLTDAEHYAILRQRFGQRVTPLNPQRGAAYKVRGGLQYLFFKLFAGTDVSFIGQEFGTYSPIHTIRALREENRWHHYGGGGLDHPTKKALKETFCPDDETWRSAVLVRGRELLRAAL
jgi:hypothetical protein